MRPQATLKMVKQTTLHCNVPTHHSLSAIRIYTHKNSLILYIFHVICQGIIAFCNAQVVVTKHTYLHTYILVLSGIDILQTVWYLICNIAV